MSQNGELAQQQNQKQTLINKKIKKTNYEH
jgi:hypothetical protein